MSEDSAKYVADKSVEEMIVEKGLSAPRVHPGDVDDAILAVQFHVFEGTTCTVCAITLKNGYVVVGHSAAAAPENFDRAIGERAALDHAKRHIWPLLGYALRDRLHHEVGEQEAGE